MKPKWQDFKVWLNDNHRTIGDLTPISGHMFGGTDPYDLGEWSKSTIVYNEESSVDPGEFITYEPELHILGPDNGNTNVGIIKQYGESRALVQSPDPVHFGNVGESVYAKSEGSLSVQTQEIIETMEVSNDEPPYSQLTYPGGSSNGFEPILYSFGANSSTGKRKLTLNGFAAPNGLLEIQFDKKLIQMLLNLILVIFGYSCLFLTG